MMHPGNPLSRSQLDEDVTDLAMYRYDAQGPFTFDGEDDVVIEHVVSNNGDALKSFVLENMDPLSQSCKMAIYLYMKALELVFHRLI